MQKGIFPLYLAAIICTRPLSACGAAFEVLLRGDVFLFAREKIVPQQLLLHGVKAKARDRIGEALAGNPLLAEKEDRLFDHIEHLAPVREDPVEIPSVRHTLCLLYTSSCV